LAGLKAPDFLLAGLKAPDFTILLPKAPFNPPPLPLSAAVLLSSILID